MRSSKNQKRGFTLVEALVTVAVVAIAVVGAFGAIRSIKVGQERAQTADLLQKLASDKMDEIKILSTPTTNGSSGNFSDRGYPDIDWTIEDQQNIATNIDQITVTVTRSQQSQALTTLLYITPTSSTNSGTTTTGATGG